MGRFVGLACLLAVFSAYAIRSANVHFTSSPVIVDGVLNESAWASADSLTAFAAPWGDSAHLRPSCVKLLWDANNFYFSAHISDSNIVQDISSGTGIDGDDMLEIHIAPDIHNSQVYVPPADWDTSNAQYFFIVEFNLYPLFRSHFRASRTNGKNNWYVSWDIASVQASVVTHVSENYYIVEMAIPFSALDTHKVETGYSLPVDWQPAIPPVLGSQWKFNVTRSDIYPGGGCFSTWNFNGNYPPGYDSTAHFHDHNNFGLLIFTDATAVEAMPGRLPAELAVSPSPMHPGATVMVLLPAVSKGACLGLFDLKGQCVMDLTNTLSTSTQRISFCADNLASGVYCLKFIQPEGAIIKKIVMMK